MLRALALRYLLPERYVAHLIARLRSSPQLRAICGFRGSLPSNSTFSRFFGLVSDRLIALEQAIAEIVDALKKRLPRMGRKVAVDSTDSESYANPRRTRVGDPDAAWGVRTRKNKTKGERKTEWFFGYKMHSLIDAVYGVPLVHVIRPANEGDTMKLRTLVNTASSAHSWFQPEYLMADKGYDSQTNHRFLHERGTAPIIHIRRPKSEGTVATRISMMRRAPPCAAKIRRCCSPERTRRRVAAFIAARRMGVRSDRETCGRRYTVHAPTNGKIPRTTCGSSVQSQGGARSGSGYMGSGRLSSACSTA